MKALKLAALLVAGLLPIAAHASICPTTASTNTDCGFILTIGTGGAVTGALVPNSNPYDGSDDALVGVINNSGAVFTGSIHLTGVGDGGGIFGFDGDGICSYVSATYCSTAATGYEGPINTFANDSTGSAGDVVITGLAAGASTFFSLEGSPASIAGAGGVGVPPSTGAAPEPSSLVLLGTGVLGVAGSLRRRFVKA